MKKKISLFILCGIVLLGLCGCGNNFENEIIGNNFINEYTSSDSKYGNFTTSHTLIFEKDNKGTSKIDIDFTGEFKEYAEKHISYDTLHTSTDFIYTINKEDNSISFKTDNDTYNLEYDKDSKCLIDKENNKIKYCK